MYELFSDFAGDFILKILVGERLAMLINSTKYIYFVIILIYIVYKHVEKRKESVFKTICKLLAI